MASRRQRHSTAFGCRRRRTGSRGSVTAELAVVLPAVTVLLALLLLGVSTGMLQLRLEEGARAGARALARGDSPGQVMEVVSKVAGEGVSIQLGSGGGYATVTVSGRAGGVLSGLTPWTQTAQAAAKTESAGMDTVRGGEADGLAAGNAPGQDGSTVQRSTVQGGAAVWKSSLWRWVRTQECPLGNGRCEAVAASPGWVGHAPG